MVLKNEPKRTSHGTSEEPTTALTEMHRSLVMMNSNDFKASSLLTDGIPETLRPEPEGREEAPRVTKPQNAIPALEHMNASPSMHAPPGNLVEEKETCLVPSYQKPLGFLVFKLIHLDWLKPSLLELANYPEQPHSYAVETWHGTRGERFHDQSPSE